MKKTKKAIHILTFILLISFLMPVLGYGADKLTLVKSYPEDGFHNSEPVNMNVKLWFNKDVLDPSVQKINSKAFRITTPSGSAVKFDVLYNTNKGHVSLLLKETLESNTEYTVTISKTLTATDKTTLGTDQTLTFSTRDVNAGNMSSMIMMGVMVVIMVIATTISTKKQAEKQEKDAKEKVNPYKVAKEKNTTVEKVIKDTQKAKDKAKRANAAGSKAKTNKDNDGKAETGKNKTAPTNKATPVNRTGAPAGSVNKGKTGSIKKITKK